ncbi:MAG: ABC transporter substrate-binding protein [Chloroflexi bacterium]|nr:ABC transporter substrate-binding protein [Chloroflexota bacterium]
MKKQLTTSMILLCILTVLTGCAGAPSPTDPAPLTEVTMQFFWTHSNLFAGFYAASENGYYAEEGLSVKFAEAGVDADYLSPVVNGAAQFGDAGADDLILARSSGKPLVALATIYRRNPSAFVALEDSGITRPEDFVGKTIRIVPQTAAHLHAMMKKVGISQDQYSEVSLPSDLDLFASGQADVWNIYTNNFGVVLQRAGYKLNFIYPDDYGVHFYADTIFTNEELLETNPDLVLRFVRASLKGWTWAVENPTEAGLLIQKYKLNADPELEIAKMLASLPLINTGEDFIGWMKPEVWAGMEQTMRDQGILTAPLDITQIYTLQFLEEIYGK